MLATKEVQSQKPAAAVSRKLEVLEQRRFIEVIVGADFSTYVLLFYLALTYLVLTIHGGRREVQGQVE